MTEVLSRSWAELAAPVQPASVPAEPWLVGDLLGVAVVNLVGLGMLLGGLQGARHSTDPHTLLLMLDVAAAGLIVSLAGNAVFLLSGLRQVGMLRSELLGTRQPVRPAAAPVPVGSADLVASTGMTRYHRPQCPSVQGKSVSAGSLSVQRKAGRVPCGLCRPEVGA